MLCRRGLEAIAHELGLDIQFEQAGAFDPVTFDESCVARIRVAADRRLSPYGSSFRGWA